MKCPSCQTENPDTRKFCRRCGAKLLLLCPECGSENLPDDFFCGECGRDLREPKEALSIDYSEPQSYTPKFLADKILTTRSSIEGERKLVTVLFADVASYTSIAEKLDPEEIHQIMDGCFKILMDEIHWYEGTINQFTGDGVMALFGAPVAHEDHAQRACHAALSIQKAIGAYGGKVNKETGLDFKMRIGLNSGPVIVGSIGDDLRMDYTAVGDTTNVAARIQQIAKPAEVWMSQETRNIIRDYFHDERVGEIPLKGKAEPQPIYRVVSERRGVRRRLEAGLVRGVTELVGRRPEMEALRSAFERVKSGEAHLVDVVGEAGVGKSRLVYEFQKRLGEEATFLTGVCVHYGRNISFLPVIDVVRAAFDIQEGMTEEEVGGRIEAQAKDDLTAMIPFYRDLLSLQVEDARFNALNPEGRKFGTFEAVKRLLFALSDINRLVVFVDDAQWMDQISEEFFTYFSRSFVHRPILILTAYRPEGIPSWGQGAHYQRLGLETLSSKSSIRLVRNMVGGLELDPALEERIVEKTGGNPFFVEEIVRELLERGDLVEDGDRYVCTRPIDECDIPGTVQGVLAARMDRLSEDLKRTMQVASVIGRDFAFRLLKSIMELGDELRAHLTNLVGLEILYEKALYPELEYIFKHALTQEVAYESLLKQRRREIHGRIARAIEELYADRVEQHYGLLAHHWELSNTPDRSTQYLVLAGEKSIRSQAASAAADFFTRALNQIERSGKAPDPNLMLRIRGGRGASFHAMGRVEEPLEDYLEAVRLSRHLGDRQMLLELLRAVSSLLYNTTLKDRVPHYLEEGLGLAREMGNKGAEASFMGLAAYYRLIWHHSDEIGRLEEALRLAKESADNTAIFERLVSLCVVERWRGNPKAALQYSQGLSQIQYSQGLSEILLSGYNVYSASYTALTHGWALTDIGKHQEAIEFQKKWMEILEQNSLFLFLGRVCNGLGWTYSEIYELREALSHNARSLEIAMELRKSPAMLFPASKEQAMTEVNLMENKYESGRIDEAWEHIARFEEISADPAYDLVRHRWATRMNDLKGCILLSRGDLVGAQAIGEQCLRVAAEKGMKKYVGKAERLLGRIMTRKGAYDLAETHLQTALAELEEVGNPKQLWTTHTALAHLYAKMKRPDLEKEQWQAAATVVRSTVEGLDDRSLRETFLGAAPVREIAEHTNL